MKPSDLFVGVVDLFAILMPGAVATYMTRAVVIFAGGTDPISQLAYLEGTAAWVAYLMSSYVFGHFVFHLGAQLDDLYDRLARPTKLTDAACRLRTTLLRKALDGLDASQASHDPPEHALWVWPVRVLSRGAWPHRKRRAGSGEVVNAFKWARSLLQLHQPSAFVEVQRLEADQKFFRGAVVVLLLAIPLVLGLIALDVLDQASPRIILLHVLYLLALAFLIRLSFARFCEQRKKTTELAYNLALAWCATRTAAAAPLAEPE